MNGKVAFLTAVMLTAAWCSESFGRPPRPPHPHRRGGEVYYFPGRVTLRLEPDRRATDDADLVRDVFRGSAGDLNYCIFAKNMDRPGAPLLVVILHGKSGSGEDNASQLANPAIGPFLEYAAAKRIKAVFLVPQCPRKSAWVDDEMMKLVVELASAKRRQYSVPDENMLLTGFSMGGGACCEFAADYPGFFAKFLIVGAAGRAEAAKKARGEFYLAVGANDRVVPPANVEATAELLGRAGCRVRLEKLSGRGHLDGGIAAYSGEARVWLLRPGKKFKRAPRSGSCGN